jgi:hypothetical protein
VLTGKLLSSQHSINLSHSARKLLHAPPLANVVNECEAKRKSYRRDRMLGKPDIKHNGV